MGTNYCTIQIQNLEEISNRVGVSQDGDCERRRGLGSDLLGPSCVIPQRERLK